ncbi:MAG: ABC transporter permease [Candidatus Pelethousia sp.]|nr:ABC transporter permease [Candidatus Pelethousia sp.]
MQFLVSFLAACPGAVSQGILWGIMALGVFLTYKVLDYADLTVDGSLCTGGAVSAILITNGMDPLLTLFFATLAGMAAGAITGLLHTKLRIPAILSGILTQLALYSINMRIMGRANVPLLGQKTIITLQSIPQAIMVGGLFALVVICILYWFFGTEVGCAIRATGNNGHMARAQGVNTDTMKLLGLTISNGLVGLSGALLSQYQGFSDVQMGRGAIVIGLASVIIGEVIVGKQANFALRMGSIILGAVVYYIIIAFVLQAGLNTNDLKLFSAATVAFALAIPALKKSISGR